jgi:hypothetical protein
VHFGPRGIHLRLLCGSGGNPERFGAVCRCRCQLASKIRSSTNSHPLIRTRHPLIRTENTLIHTRRSSAHPRTTRFVNGRCDNTSFSTNHTMKVRRQTCLKSFSHDRSDRLYAVLRLCTWRVRAAPCAEESVGALDTFNFCCPLSTWQQYPSRLGSIPRFLTPHTKQNKL